MGVIKTTISIFHIRGIGAHLSEPVNAMIVREGQTKAGRYELVEAVADTFRNNDHRIAAEAVSVETSTDYEGEREIDLRVRFHGSAKDNRPEFDRWVKFCVEKAAREVGGDREDNPAKFRTEEYDGSTEKRIYPEDIAKVYPALRGAMRSLTKHEREEVINLLWSFIAATIEESPILQKAGWAVGRQPDGDNFAVYYETCPRGQSFEDIIEQDAILAVKEAAGGRSDNPRKSGLSLGAVAIGAALGAAAMHFSMKPKQ